MKTDRKIEIDKDNFAQTDTQTNREQLKKPDRDSERNRSKKLTKEIRLDPITKWLTKRCLPCYLSVSIFQKRKGKNKVRDCERNFSEDL